jgi:transposase InsO family protein/transposase-like protein
MAYPKDARDTFLDYYFTHDGSVESAARMAGMPQRPDPATLTRWIRLDPRFGCVKAPTAVKYPLEIRVRAMRLMDTGLSAVQTAQRLGIRSHTSVSEWRKAYKRKGVAAMRPKETTGPAACAPDAAPPPDDIAGLKRRNHELELENDILRGAIDILKKDPGFNVEGMNNKEKTLLANALRPKYRLKEITDSLRISKSSYEYQVHALRRPDRYAEVRTRVQGLFEEGGRVWGYRTIWAKLRRPDALKEGEEPLPISEKVVRALMREDGLVPLYHRKKRHYNSYGGEIDTAPPNLLERDFKADAPNLKWLTDITEFPIPAGKVYLSPIIDCFDGMPVSWTIGVHPNAALVNTMLKGAASTLGKDGHPAVHSDRGAHYRWPGWLAILEEHGLIRSMSKKACSPDNSACEGFFGRLKNEFFYYRDWEGVSVDEFIERLDSYMRYYREERIKKSLGWMSPAQYRRSLGYAA